LFIDCDTQQMQSMTYDRGISYPAG